MPLPGQIVLLILFVAVQLSLGQAGHPAALNEESFSKTGIHKVDDEIKSQSFIDAVSSVRDSSMYVVYERSLERSGRDATMKILANLEGKYPNDINKVYLTVNDRNTPIYTYTFPVKENKLKTEDGQYEIGSLPKYYAEMNKISAQTANYRLAFSLDPQIRFAFGARPDPVQGQFNLLPSLTLHLWKGSQIHIQYIVPVWNELQIPEQEDPRPGPMVFSQFFRIGKGAFTNVNVGYFSNYRYGTQLQLGKFLLNERLFLGFQAGYTGYASYPKRLLLEQPEPGWQVSDINYLDYQFMIGWRWDKHNVQVNASYGRGLFEQEIKMVTLNRQFKNTTIAFFVQQLDEEMNYGLQVRIPIPFARTFVGDKITLQTGPFIDYNYNGTQYYPATYDTGQLYPFFNNHLHPNLIFTN